MRSGFIVLALLLVLPASAVGQPCDPSSAEPGVAGVCEAVDEAAAKVATDEILEKYVRHDHELDDFEVGPARVAIAKRLGVDPSKLPASVEARLANPIPSSNVKVANYDLNFDLCGGGPKYPAKVRITLENDAPEITILEVDASRIAIDRVRADGQAVAVWEMKDGRLFVRAPFAKVIEVDYSVEATTAPAGHGLVRDPRSGRMWTMTWPYFSGSLFPSNSDPADGSTARITPKACAGAEILATGTARGRGFKTNRDAPAYAIALYKTDGAFEHGSAEDGRIHGFGIGTTVAAATRVGYRKAAGAALVFYSDWLGEYEYGPSLSIVELAAGGMGGMEHTAAVAIMTDSARDPESADEVAAHEVAHHWFGDNLRIASWPDFWMSEGFTDYATWRWFRSARGESEFQAKLKEGRAAVKAQLRSDPHPLHPPADTDIHDIFDSIPYEMGAWMLRMMEAEAGTERFDPMLREWYQAHRFEPVSTEMFLAFASDRLGKDQRPWFESWNGITALPSFDGSVVLAGSRATVTLAATTAIPDVLKTVPLVLYGTGGAAKTVQVVPGQPVTVDAGFEIVRTAWDPEMTLLAEVR